MPGVAPQSGNMFDALDTKYGPGASSAPAAVQSAPTGNIFDSLDTKYGPKTPTPSQAAGHFDPSTIQVPQSSWKDYLPTMNSLKETGKTIEEGVTQSPPVQVAKSLISPSPGAQQIEATLPHNNAAENILSTLAKPIVRGFLAPATEGFAQDVGHQIATGFNEKQTPTDQLNSFLNSATFGMSMAATLYGGSETAGNKLATTKGPVIEFTPEEINNIASEVKDNPNLSPKFKQGLQVLADEGAGLKVTTPVKAGGVRGAVGEFLGGKPTPEFEVVQPKEGQVTPFRGAESPSAPSIREQLGAGEAAGVEAPKTGALSIREQLSAPEPTETAPVQSAALGVRQQLDQQSGMSDFDRAAQQGSVNPGQAFEDIKASIDKFKQDVADTRAGEALRAKFVGNEASRVVIDNHFFDDMQKVVTNPLEQEALTLYRNFRDPKAFRERLLDQDFKDNPESSSLESEKRVDEILKKHELQHMIDGTHPAYQEAIDFYTKHNPGATETDIAAFKAAAVKDVQKFIKPIQLAMNPSSSLVAADKAYTEFAKSHLKEGRDLGILDSKIKPENYVPQMTTPSVKPRGYQSRVGSAKLGGKFVNSMERQFPTPLHGVIAGAMPKSINAITNGRIYAQHHAAAAATTEFLQELSDIQLANLNAENVPTDWEMVKVGARKNVYLPKKVADAIKPLLEKNPDVSTLQKLSNFQKIIKAGEVSASIFHLKALSLTAVNSMSSTGFIKASMSDMESPTFRNDEIDFVKHSGTTPEQGKTAEAYKMANQGTAITQMDMIKSTPGIKQVVEFSDELTRLTFDVAQRKFKVNDYALQRDAWMGKHPEATPEELFNAKLNIAKDVNATYGGLNLDVLGVSKYTRFIAKVLFFAPDWTYSNVLKGKYVFTNEGARWNAFKFFMKSAIVTYVLSQMASLLVGHKLSKHPFKVYLGTDKNGKEMYGNWFAVGAFGDWVNELTNVQKSGLITGTAVTVGNKMASLPRSIIHQLTNQNYLGQTITTKGASPVVNTIRSAMEAASENLPLPFGLIDSIKYAIDEKTARNFWDYATIILGQPTTHEIPQGSHVPTTGQNKGQVVQDKPGTGSNRPQQSLWQQIVTGKLYQTTQPKGRSGRSKAR